MDAATGVASDLASPDPERQSPQLNGRCLSTADDGGSAARSARRYSGDRAPDGIRVVLHDGRRPRARQPERSTRTLATATRSRAISNGVHQAAAFDAPALCQSAPRTASPGLRDGPHPDGRRSPGGTADTAGPRLGLNRVDCSLPAGSSQPRRPSASSTPSLACRTRRCCRSADRLAVDRFE